MSAETVRRLKPLLDQPTIDTPPQAATIAAHDVVALTLPFVFASESGDRRDQFTVQLYHCPTCPQQQLRLTWDALRRRHAGFCLDCKKLWPLPRRTPTPDELRQVADQRELELKTAGAP